MGWDEECIWWIDCKMWLYPSLLASVILSSYYFGISAVLEIFKNFLLADVRCGIITRDIVVYGKTSQTFIAFQKSVSMGKKKQLQS